MKRFIQFIGKALGIRFAPDNHVVPVLRLERFDRIEGSGYFWIKPFIEATLAPVSVGMKIGAYTFEEVLSQDNISFTVNLTVLFRFDPNLPPDQVLAQVVRLPAATLHNIVKDYASQGLRRLVSGFSAETLICETAMTHIERDLTNYLRAQLRVLGLVPLRKGGVLIKETIAPEKFKQTMLAVKQHQATLQALGAQPDENLIEQAIRAQFLTGLEGHGGNLTLWSSLDGTSFPPHYLFDPSERSGGKRSHKPHGTNGKSKGSLST
ncbi:MAG: SPFH domain-containing protein [Chloroflexi bacterium]|nr:SPFH domain-containing protein [Chloroflexota bacterium]